ncbi:uncharacterized protein LACBIDRAFT_321441 [Laccaria bicolor S238N-H82]|uniref:Predicted protein n=1 Tax=Laccaria bicolor (strain S238N-H82 / ATCC MYA-4686) TaxID=486041 RepID=B0CQD5_LACBS|nr:uncharacterized protein LACBIDRAFT_321441 [Laccaria bicolor S238N-H82]EDR15533.1 predicted protein [Laccaria bicolor S238N-H82]|eukprot:XP_001873741.1 predicted protein [Laccaria bicolor S238N-H82]
MIGLPSWGIRLRKTVEARTRETGTSTFNVQRSTSALGSAPASPKRCHLKTHTTASVLVTQTLASFCTPPHPSPPPELIARFTSTIVIPSSKSFSLLTHCIRPAMSAGTVCPPRPSPPQRGARCMAAREREPVLCAVCPPPERVQDVPLSFSYTQPSYSLDSNSTSPTWLAHTKSSTSCTKRRTFCMPSAQHPQPAGAELARRTPVTQLAVFVDAPDELITGIAYAHSDCQLEVLGV